MRAPVSPAGWIAAAGLAFAALAALAAPARAQALIADLSSHLIAITTGFAGTEILLFGATEGEGGVVVVVRGPETTATVRRKARVGGIWINRDQVSFTGVPTFYRVAASGPLAELAPAALRQRHQIGLDQLRLNAERALDPAEEREFRDGLMRNKERRELFSSEVGRVSFLGPRLFRTRLVLPANVPTGSYTVEVFLIRDAQVIAAQSTPLIVSKIGIAADVFEFAHRQAALYGILAIALSLLAGWGAGVLFRKA